MNEQSKLATFWSYLTTARVFLVNLIFLGILLFLLTFILSAIFSGSQKEDPSGKTLEFNPKGPIVEQIASSSPDPLDFLLYGNVPQAERARDVLEMFEALSKDERIETVLLRLDNIGGTGQTVLYDIGKALQKVKDSGKRIIAVSDYFQESSYYLASYADEIILNPNGGVYIDGYHRSRLYYKSFIEKTKVTINLFRVGKYKSAMEPYIRDSMSEADKEAALTYMNDLWGSWKSVVAKNRNLDIDQIQNYPDSFDSLYEQEKGNGSQVALKIGLVDNLLNRVETREYLRKIIGENDEEELLKISSSNYLETIRSEKDKNKSKNKIAVIIASGTILDGYQPAGMIGGDSTANLIREAHEDENTKAIVLRVDSGGGSAFASEVIREELELAKTKGIKIVASMGNVAASGGYWISAAANEIWASHDTITGSIGIFGLFPTIDKTLEEIGISSDTVGTTKLTSPDPFEELNSIYGKALQSEIEYGYVQFINLVSKSRNMSYEEVDAIAQGRVWSGEDAIDIGLVDSLGNLNDAIRRASELAEIEDDFFLTYPKVGSSWQEQLFSSFSVKNGLSNLVETNINNQLKELLELNSLNDPRNIYLKCLDCIIK